jgi:hypothetical protein
MARRSVTKEWCTRDIIGKIAGEPWSLVSQRVQCSVLSEAW